MIVVVYYSFSYLTEYFNIGYFWLGLIIQYLNFTKSSSIFKIRSKFSTLMACKLVKGDPQDMGRDLLKSYQEIDYMTVDSKEFMKDQEGHTVISDDTIDLPIEFFIRALVPRRERRMLTYWGIDEIGSYYILRSSF